MADLEAVGSGTPPRARVLVVENDPVLSDLLHAVLTDEGYAVEAIGPIDPDAIRDAFHRIKPDCVLLDGASKWDYGTS